MNYKRNKRFMHIVRQLHGLVEQENTQKHRESENQMGNLLSKNKNFTFSDDYVHTIHAEWTRYIYGTHDNQIVFYCHGGGYMTGSTSYARGITTKLAKYTQHDVFSFDYRLAPESPFPAAIEDSFSAWLHILSKGFQPKDIIIAGDSAGGNMALVLTLLLKEKGYSLPKCLILFSPWTDMTSSGDSYLSKAEYDPILTASYLQKATSNYLQGTSSSLPYVSPLFADLHDFPPVYIQVGENEILQDDSIQLYKALLSCNVHARLDIFPGMWHVFQMAPFKSAKIAMNKVAEFINQIS